MRRLPPVLLAAALTGCSHPHADFHLPDPGPPEPGHYVWHPLPDPVLGRGEPGSWDAVDTLNPTIVSFGGQLWNFYSGFDGRTWSTGAAVSRDGLSWLRHDRVLAPQPATWEGGYIAANGAALVRDGVIHYWYQAGSPPRIGLARSSDGINFSRLPQPVLSTGPFGSWFEKGVADPYVIAADGSYYMYFLGQDVAGRQQLGLARSADGQNWVLERTNPIMSFGINNSLDENGLGEPAVWTAHGHYWMLYTGRDRHEVRRMGLARSRDGVKWETTSLVISHPRPWSAKVLCDATVLVDGGRVRVWFGGGDVAHPAENIHGQIGYGELRFQRP